jgi:hypothetical protein
MCLDNTGLPLMVVGMMQGIYEAYSGLTSEVEWEFSETGDLEVQVTPRGRIIQGMPESA